MYTATRHLPKIAPARLVNSEICRWTHHWQEDSKSLRIWLVILMLLVLCKSFRTTTPQPLEVVQSEAELPPWTTVFRRMFARCWVVVTLLRDPPGLIRWFVLGVLPPSPTSRSPSDPACQALASECVVLLKRHRATNFRLSILPLAFGDLGCGKVS